MLGAGLLWVGWYGFNVGSIVFGATASRHRAVPRRDRPDLRQHHAGDDGRDPRLAADRVPHARKATSLGAASGIVAGLVAITPACWCGRHLGRGRHRRGRRRGLRLAVGLKYKLGYDDSLDVVGVHLVGGLVGTVADRAFSTSDGAGGVDGLFYGGGFG